MKNFCIDSWKTPKTTYFNLRGQKYFRKKNISLEYLFSMQHKPLCDLSYEHVFNFTLMLEHISSSVPEKNSCSWKTEPSPMMYFISNTCHPHSSRLKQGIFFSLEIFPLSPKQNRYFFFVALLPFVNIFTTMLDPLYTNIYFFGIKHHVFNHASPLPDPY